MPVVLLECPVVVAEEAVLALHADLTVVELSAVPRFEDSTKLLCRLARELVGPVGEGAVVAKAALRGLQPVLADLGLVPHIEGHVGGRLVCHLNLGAKLHWNEVLRHLPETRWRERWLLHRHVAVSARRETGHECGDKLRRGGLERRHIGLERIHRSSRSGATARTELACRGLAAVIFHFVGLRGGPWVSGEGLLGRLGVGRPHALLARLEARAK